MSTIKVERAGKYAHKAIFTDLYGNVREVFTLNGESAARSAALRRINDQQKYIKPNVRVRNVAKFLNKLFKRRTKNKISNKTRSFTLKNSF